VATSAWGEAEAPGEGDCIQGSGGGRGSFQGRRSTTPRAEQGSQGAVERGASTS
jgi:hypothetical protein